jgi:hypothetical protein
LTRKSCSAGTAACSTCAAVEMASKKFKQAPENLVAIEKITATAKKIKWLLKTRIGIGNNFFETRKNFHGLEKII